jgi:hypothetical protein
MKRKNPYIPDTDRWKAREAANAAASHREVNLANLDRRLREMQADQNRQDREIQLLFKALKAAAKRNKLILNTVMQLLIRLGGARPSPPK